MVTDEIEKLIQEHLYTGPQAVKRLGLPSSHALRMLVISRSIPIIRCGTHFFLYDRQAIDDLAEEEAEHV